MKKIHRGNSAHNVYMPKVTESEDDEEECANLCLLTDFYRRIFFSLCSQTRKEAHTNYKLDLIKPRRQRENNNIVQCAKKYGADKLVLTQLEKLQCCKKKKGRRRP